MNSEVFRAQSFDKERRLESISLECVNNEICSEAALVSANSSAHHDVIPEWWTNHTPHFTLLSALGVYRDVNFHNPQSS